MIVDTGNSYQGLSSLIRQKTKGRDGIYFTYQEDAPVAFNPFFVEDGVYDVEKRESLKALLLTLGSANPRNRHVRKKWPCRTHPRVLGSPLFLEDCYRRIMKGISFIKFHRIVKGAVKKPTITERSNLST